MSGLQELLAAGAELAECGVAFDGYTAEDGTEVETVYRVAGTIPVTAREDGPPLPEPPPTREPFDTMAPESEIPPELRAKK